MSEPFVSPTESSVETPGAPEPPAGTARRAVVFSGGGAKGVFESGAVHALARIGFAPDVLTGSSAGALNAVAFAEILRARREQGEAEAERVLERSLALWVQLDRQGIADLDRWGWRLWAAAALVIAAALLGARFPIFQWMVAFGLIAAVAWIVAWWLGLPRRLRRSIRRGIDGPPADGRDTTQRNGGRRAASAPASAPRSGHAVLRALGVFPSVFGNARLERALEQIVPADRRFSDYRRAGVDLRLTRTNVRTGRTEISEHLVPADAARPGVDRGRRVLGDPRALPAALASAAFPAAFPPVPAVRLYPPDENPHLYRRLVERANAKRELRSVFGAQAKAQYLWLMSLLDELSDRRPEWLRVGGETDLITYLQAHFIGERVNWSRISGRALLAVVETREWPQLPVDEHERFTDRYFDGGILDNTPLSTALAALRDADSRDRDAGADVPTEHEMIVVLVAPLPRRRYLSAEESDALGGPAIGARALRLQAEKRVYDDLRNAERIDKLLTARDEHAEERAAATPAAPPAAPAPASSWEAVFAGERGAAAGARDASTTAPASPRYARVDVTRVYPAWDLPWVLALDDRLGFERTLARDFQARGCRDTLSAIFHRHGPRARAGSPVPAYAEAAMRLVTGRWDTPSAPGWACRAENCLLREACDRVAAREKANSGGAPASAAPAAGTVTL